MTQYVPIRDRPAELPGTTKRVRTGHGNLYVTINRDKDGKPFEVFATLGKAGTCDTAMMEAVTRLTSLALRAKIDPEEIIRQLLGITCHPFYDGGRQNRSPADAIAQVLLDAIGGKLGQDRDKGAETANAKETETSVRTSLDDRPAGRSAE